MGPGRAAGRGGRTTFPGEPLAASGRCERRGEERTGGEGREGRLRGRPNMGA